MGRPEAAQLPVGFKYRGLDALYGKGKSKDTAPREFVRPAKVPRIARSAATGTSPADAIEILDSTCIGSNGSNDTLHGGAGTSSDPLCLGSGNADNCTENETAQPQSTEAGDITDLTGDPAADTTDTQGPDTGGSPVDVEDLDVEGA